MPSRARGGGVVLQRRVTIDDQLTDRYLHVPVEVGPGWSGLHVTLTVQGEGAVIDLGCEGAQGWRGWSGGARKEFWIGPDAATPGYLPGEVEAGTWHVVLGLHQIPPDGVHVQVATEPVPRVEVPAEPLAPVLPRGLRGSARAVPAEPGLRWYAGDFHAHTTHSDGSESVDQLAARAVQAGLDFVAVTDHNTVSHFDHLAAAASRHGVTLIPGQEVTTADGHANALGNIGWVDFREPTEAWLSQISADGGILSINHPLDADCAWLYPTPPRPAVLEVWHISWFRDLTATGPWSLWQRWGQAPVTPLGGSDFHAPGQGWTLGMPTTWVAAEDDSPEAILAGVAAGRTAISVGVHPDASPNPLGSPLLVRTGGDLHILDAEGGVLVDGLGRRRRITSTRERARADPAEGPYRVIDPVRRIVALAR